MIVAPPGPILSAANTLRSLTVLSALLKTKPPLDEASIQWMFETFAWAVAHFDDGCLRTRTTLVLPTNRFFPGRAETAQDMAALVFERVVEYAGLSRWPLTLAPHGTCALPVAGKAGPSRPTVSGPFRGPASEVRIDGEAKVTINYDPALVGNPEALIANLALSLADLLVSFAPEAPPGGADNRSFAAEILAVLMGFGVMMANSAKTIQVRSCGSCGSHQSNRQSFLSEYDMTYALALFCALKGGDAVKQAQAHLRGPLRPWFKRSVRDITTRSQYLDPLLRLM